MVWLRLFSYLLASALTGCMSARPPLGLPDQSVIGFDGVNAVGPDCRLLEAPSHLIDAGSARPTVAFGCATYTNLADMLARPADLVAPLPYEGGDASLGATAVRRLAEDKIKGKKATDTTKSSYSNQ